MNINTVVTMGFDKSQLKHRKKQLVEQLSSTIDFIGLLEEEIEDYTDYLSDENKEHQLEVWDEKLDDLLDLKISIKDWIELSKTIK